MKSYIAVKIVKGKPMNLGDYNNYRGWDIPKKEDLKREGYLVEYKDGYQSWSPKEAFEDSHLDLGDDPTRIIPEVVDSIIAEVEVSKIDEKTSLVKAEMVTGFTQFATSACVCPENYDEEIGKEIGMKEIKNKLWFALGFVLQWGRFGLNEAKRG